MFCGFVVVVERCQKFFLLLSKEPRVDVITSHNSVASLLLLPRMHFPGIPAVVPKCLLFIAALVYSVCSYLGSLGKVQGGHFLIRSTWWCVTACKLKVVYEMWIQFSCLGSLCYDHIQVLQLRYPPCAVIICKMRSCLFWWAFSLMFCGTEKFQLGKIWNVKQQRFSAGMGVFLEQLTRKWSGVCVRWVGFYSSTPFFSPLLTTLAIL